MTSSGAVQAELPITTAQELPGVEIAESLGLCFGLIVRSMGFAKGFTASFSALRSGEVSQYTEVLEDSRRHAVDRMIANAHVSGPTRSSPSASTRRRWTRTSPRSSPTAPL